jgi:hypothetical protein
MNKLDLTIAEKIFLYKKKQMERERKKEWRDSGCFFVQTN